MPNNTTTGESRFSMPGDKAPSGENVTSTADGKVLGVDSGKEIDPKEVVHTPDHTDQTKFEGNDSGSGSDDDDGGCFLM